MRGHDSLGDSESTRGDQILSPELTGLIGVIFLLVLLASRMWIAMSTAIIGFIGIAYVRGFDQAFSSAGTAPYLFIGRYTLAVIPMFILMGMIVSEAGIATELYKMAHRWIGHLRGGLAAATVAATALFAAITGSSLSGLAVMSKVALPEMRRYKYDDRLSAGTIAAGSTMGILIPPSIGFVLYGVMTEISIGKLFMAGIIPGILEAVFYIITITILCRVRPQMGPPGPSSTLKEKIVSLRGTWAVVALFLLVMGGIYGGIFTPTEAGAVGAFGAIVISMVRRQFSVKSFFQALREAGMLTAMILLMLMGVSIFQGFVAISKLPFLLGDFITGLGVSNIVVILAIVILYIIIGCFLPPIMAIILTIPVIFPVVLAMGFDPIWYGVIMVRIMEIGVITPPMGMQCFVLSGVTGIPLGTIFRGVIPFIVADILHIALLIAVPSLSLFLPNMM